MKQQLRKFIMFQKFQSFLFRSRLQVWIRYDFFVCISLTRSNDVWTFQVIWSTSGKSEIVFYSLIVPIVGITRKTNKMPKKCFKYGTILARFFIFEKIMWKDRSNYFTTRNSVYTKTKIKIHLYPISTHILRRVQNLNCDVTVFQIPSYIQN